MCHTSMARGMIVGSNISSIMLYYHPRLPLPQQVASFQVLQLMGLSAMGRRWGYRSHQLWDSAMAAHGATSQLGVCQLIGLPATRYWVHMKIKAGQKSSIKLLHVFQL